jgi:ComF family protein
MRCGRPSIVRHVPGTLLDRLVSLVVPPLCVACREPEAGGAALCVDCRDGLGTLGPGCLRCAAPVGAPVARCRECGDRMLAFERAWAPFAYDGPARQLVMALKARSATQSARFMASAIAARAPAGHLHGVLVPVPGHPSGGRRRGFDHAGVIAARLAELTGLPVAPALRRRPARPQVGLARPQREANARGSVELRIPAARVPSRVVLVDDVYTTGATIDACAQALRTAGASEVRAVCFARTVRRPKDRWRTAPQARSIEGASHSSEPQEVER